ncbi:hypothetical protein CPB85DRAFT_1259553 [Mucidula mucida]|nr:hypothetical protein CPB85DRAFT_1259553 [Mucidula mucida]
MSIDPMARNFSSRSGGRVKVGSARGWDQAWQLFPWLVSCFLRTGHSMSAAGGGRNQATFDLRDSFFRLTNFHPSCIPPHALSSQASQVQFIPRRGPQAHQASTEDAAREASAQRPLFHRERASFDGSMYKMKIIPARPVTPPQNHTGLFPRGSPHAVSYWIREQLDLAHGSAFTEAFQNSGIIAVDDIIYLANLCNSSHINRLMFQAAMGLDHWDRNWDIMKTLIRLIADYPPTAMESGIGAAEYQRCYDIRHALEEQEREEILRERMRVDEVLTGVLIDEHINEQKERPSGIEDPRRSVNTRRYIRNTIMADRKRESSSQKGRPRLYHTEEERKEATKERNRQYYEGHRDYVLKKSAARYTRRRRQEEVASMIAADPANRLMKQRLLSMKELLDEATSHHNSLRRHTGGAFCDYVWHYACSCADLVDNQYAVQRVKDEISRIEQFHNAFKGSLTGLKAVCGGVEREQMQILAEANADFQTVETYLTDLLKHIQKKTLVKALKKRTLACSTFIPYESK